MRTRPSTHGFLLKKGKGLHNLFSNDLETFQVFGDLVDHVSSA